MRRAILSATVALFTLVSQHAAGTTWGKSTVKDPISGARLTVAEPASFGSYIYDWPEKSDQVFWPYTDDNWLWFSEKTGFIAFGDDFAKVDDATRESLRQWLLANFDRRAPPRTRLERLRWAERVYQARGMNDEFWCRFLRLMAFETRSDRDQSNQYAARALPLLAAELAAATGVGPKLQALYLLSEYNRRIGNVGESDRFLELLKSMEAGEKLAGFKNYLIEIALSQRAAN